MKNGAINIIFINNMYYIIIYIYQLHFNLYLLSIIFYIKTISNFLSNLDKTYIKFSVKLCI